MEDLYEGNTDEFTVGSASMTEGMRLLFYNDYQLTLYLLLGIGGFSFARYLYICTVF